MIYKYYTYVYLDPRKPGKYAYLENGFGVDFDYEPFYIGAGKDNRMYNHLEMNKKDNNTIKKGKIKHIQEIGLNPIIFKIYESNNRKNALDIEKFLVKLIGRINNKTGCLSNMTDAGDGGDTLSNHLKKDEINKKVREAKERRTNKILNEIKNIDKDLMLSIYNENLSLEDTRKKYNKNKGTKFTVKSLRIWLKDNNIKRYIKNFKEISEEHFLKNNKILIELLNANISVNATIIKYNEMFDTKFDSFLLNTYCKKYNIKRPKYKSQPNKLNDSFIIDLYFLNFTIYDIMKEYNMIFNTNYSSVPFRQRLNLLNFPNNGAGRGMTKAYKEKLNFIIENQHKKKEFYDKIFW